MSTAIPSFAHAAITRDDRGVYTLRITDAKSLNVLGTPVIRGLTQAVDWIAGQADARAVVLRGTGEKAFVGGADIYEMAELVPSTARTFITNLRTLCEAVRNIPVPTIARIPGHCLGAGLELAAVCDLRLASDQARFGMPEVRVGIPSVIHACLLPSLIGQGAANWLLLSGESVDAAQALRWGLVQFVTTPDNLDRLVEQTAASIASGAAQAVRAQKALLRSWEESTLNAGLDRSVAAFGAAYETAEPRQYMEPFLKRKRAE